MEDLKLLETDLEDLRTEIASEMNNDRTVMKDLERIRILAREFKQLQNDYILVQQKRKQMKERLIRSMKDLPQEIKNDENIQRVLEVFLPQSTKPVMNMNQQTMIETNTNTAPAPASVMIMNKKKDISDEQFNAIPQSIRGRVKREDVQLVLDLLKTYVAQRRAFGKPFSIPSVAAESGSGGKLMVGFSGTCILNSLQHLGYLKRPTKDSIILI